jgi:hypothetical protein
MPNLKVSRKVLFSVPKTVTGLSIHYYDEEKVLSWKVI